MALRINLYHEVLRTKKQAKYDPLKISIFGGILIAIGLVAWYFIVLAEKSTEVGKYNNMKQEMDGLQPQQEKAVKEEADYKARLALMEKMRNRIEDRFYWAPLLEDLAVCAPAFVQLTRVTGDVTGEGPRKCTINVDGIAAGSEPRAAAEDFRIALADRLGKRYKTPAVAFKTLDDGVEQAQLEGKTLRTATFSIAVSFQFGKEPPPPPPPPRPSRAAAKAANPEN